MEATSLGDTRFGIPSNIIYLLLKGFHQTPV
jgi:hypothetical protein